MISNSIVVFVECKQFKIFLLYLFDLKRNYARNLNMFQKSFYLAQSKVLFHRKSLSTVSRPILYIFLYFQIAMRTHHLIQNALNSIQL